MSIAQIRLLQTTDLHMHLLGYDYVRDAPSNRLGLAELIPLIEAARGSAETTLLFDNGDFLQGTPMADLVAEGGCRADMHPMVKAFNDLNYDAIGLGNHDFDFGLPFLTDALKGCDAPILCANARTSPTKYIAAPWVILDRQVTCSDGAVETVRIGVISFLPPQTVDWNAFILSGEVQVDDILAAARSHLPALQRSGADVIVALCHAGISDAPLTPRMENAALHLAGLPGIDVIMAGHTHDAFPSDDFACTAGVDIAQGTIAGKPALMAGAFGNMLGQLDLTLEREDDGWQLIGHTALLHRLPQSTPRSAAQDRFVEDIKTRHDETLARLHLSVCETPRPLDSRFAALGRDDSADILATVMLNAARDVLTGTEFENLPRLAATSPHRAGGHAGPDNFFHIPPGQVLSRDVAAIVPFNNPMTLMLRWGWQIKSWLETSSKFFHTLAPGKQDQPLVNGQVASYHFDTLHGLRYRFDLSVPPRLDDDLSRPMRVRDITFNGLPVRDDDRFVVAASSYRAHGGGGYDAVAHGDIIHSSDKGLADVLADDLRRNGVAAQPAEPCWHFAPLQGTSAWLASSPDAAGHLPDGLRLTALGQDAKGFQRVRLTL